MSSGQKRIFCDIRRSEGISEANKCIKQKRDNEWLPVERAWEATDKLEE